MRIAIASGHAAFQLKAELRDYLIGLGHEVADLGQETADRADYPAPFDALRYAPPFW